MLHYYKNILLLCFRTAHWKALGYLLRAWQYYIVQLWQKRVRVAIVSQLPHYLDLSHYFNAVILRLRKIGNQFDGHLLLGCQALGKHDISEWPFTKLWYDLVVLEYALPDRLQIENRTIPLNIIACLRLLVLVWIHIHFEATWVELILILKLVVDHRWIYLIVYKTGALIVI